MIRCDLAPRVRALSQLVSGLESLQRLGATFGVLRSVKTSSNVSFRSNNGGVAFSGSKAGAGVGLLEFGSPTREKNTPSAPVPPMNPITSPPRVVNVTGVSVEADLNSCAGKYVILFLLAGSYLSSFTVLLYNRIHPFFFRLLNLTLLLYFLAVAAGEVLAAQEALFSEYAQSREIEADTPDGRGVGSGGVSLVPTSSSSALTVRVDEGSGAGGRSTPSRSHSPLLGGGGTPQTSNTGLRMPLFDSLLFEVAIAVVATEEEEPLHYETVYCGNSTRFTQAGLSPNCTYLLRCRASIGPLLLDWSTPVKFHTEPGICFGFDPMKCGADILLGDDNLSASYAGDDNWSTLLGTRPFSCGRVSWEIRVLHSSTAYVFVGVATASADLNTFLGGCANGWGFIGEQALYHNRENVKGFGEAFTAGDTVGVHLDFHAGTLSFSRNGKSLGVAFDKICGELYPAVAFYNVGQELEIVPNSFTSSCPQDTIPCTPARLNLSAVSNLTELLLCINTGVPLSLRVLTAVAEHCNQWVQGKQIRLKVLSGRCMFISTDEHAPLMRQYGLGVGQRVRTPLGIAQLEGSACGRMWFTFAATGNTWCFTNHQIRLGREKGYFTQCSYDSSSAVVDNAVVGIAAAAVAGDHDYLSAAGGGAASSHTTTSASTTALTTTTTSDSGSGTSATSAAASSTSFDVAFLQDTLDPARWPSEMDALLINFVTKIADAKDLSPWAVSCDLVCEDFRTLQQQLTRHVMTHADLSHKWGISGPKRKAVLGRLGLLRYLNHELDMYLPAVLNNTESILTKAAAAAALADKTTTVSDKKSASAAGNGGQDDFFPTYVTSIDTIAVVSRENEVLPVTTTAASYSTTNTATNGNSGGSNGSMASMLSMVDGAFVSLVSCDGDEIEINDKRRGSKPIFILPRHFQESKTCHA